MSQEENKKKKARTAANTKNGKNPGTTKGRTGEEEKDGAHYNSMVQSLLDIWNVLAVAPKPLTATQIGDCMKAGEKHTSSSTAMRRMEDGIELINTVHPHSVLRTEGQPGILHTYPHNDALHVVLENPDGEPFWNGEMTAVLYPSSINPVPQTTLNKKMVKLAEDCDEMKDRATEKQLEQAKANGKKTLDPEITKFHDDYPPLSVAALVATKTKTGKKVYISHTTYLDMQDIDENPPKTPTRSYYLESILTPEEWQLLSDVILVYPYISDRQTSKLISAMKRMAPGSRKWNNLVQAPKNPSGIHFPFIRQLEEAIQAQHKVGIEYGRYQLAQESGKWKPRLQADDHGYYETEPYALTWSNGYYYLVCRVKMKDNDGKTVWEMRNFRVDRIRDVQSSTSSFKKPADFDVYRYRDNSPVMYAGKAIPIMLRCHISMLSVLMDFFGSAIESFSEEDKDHYTTVKVSATENGTKLFALQYLDRVQVLAPQSLRDEIASTLRTATFDYM